MSSLGPANSLVDRLLGDIARIRATGVKPKTLFVAPGVCNRVRRETGERRLPCATSGMMVFDGVLLYERADCERYAPGPEDVTFDVVRMDVDQSVYVVARKGDRCVRKPVDVTRYEGMKVGREVFIGAAVRAAEDEALADLAVVESGS